MSYQAIGEWYDLTSSLARETQQLPLGLVLATAVLWLSALRGRLRGPVSPPVTHGLQTLVVMSKHSHE